MSRIKSDRIYKIFFEVEEYTQPVNTWKKLNE